MKQEEKKEYKREVTIDMVDETIEPLEGFACPITCLTMKDPFIIAEEGEGHSYEKEDVKQWLSENSISPLTGKSLSQKRLLPNHNLKKVIEVFQKADIYWIPLSQHQQELNSLKQEVEGQVQVSVPPKQETMAQKAKQLTAAPDSISSLPAVSQKIQQKPLIGLNRKKQKKKDDKGQAGQGPIEEVEAEIERAFTCPLTRKRMKEPVIAVDGYSYEKEAIAHYLKSSLISPVTGKTLPDKRLVPNHNLRQAIEDFSQKKSHWITRSQHGQALDKILREAESRLQSILSQTQAPESPDSKQFKALALKKVSRVPLFEAVGNGQLDQVQWLLKNGASLEERDNLGWTALLLAAWNGQLKMVQWLLKNGASLKEKDDDGDTALLVAADAGQLKMVQWLLKNGASLEERDNLGWTALLMAAYRGQLETVQWLLENGANLTEKGKDSSTALLLAVYNGQFKTVRWLLKNGAKLTEKNNFGCTALLAAASKGRIRMVQWLLKNGASLAERDNLGWTALLVAANHGQLEMLQWLLENGATLEERNNQGATALLLAAGRGQLKVVQWLTQNGASLKEKDDQGSTALLMTACNGQLEMVQWLLENGVSVTERNNFNDTALLVAAGYGQLEIVQRLLKNGASLAEKNKSGNTALLLAASHGQLGVVQWLLENGSSLTERNNQGHTALLMAAYDGQLKMVQWLLKKGISATEKNINGSTALHIAAYKGQLEIVQCLLKNGANLAEKDNYGKTALQIATMRGHHKVIEWLKKEEARQTSINAALKKESKHAQASSSTTTNSTGSVSSSVEPKGSPAPASNQSYTSAPHSQFFAPISAQQQILNERLQQQLEKINKLLDTVYPAEDTAHAELRAKYRRMLQKYESSTQPVTEGDLKLLQQIQQRLEKEQAQVVVAGTDKASHL